MWLLPQQLPYFGIKRVSGTQSITFPSTLLVDPGNVSAYPISFVPRALQVHILTKSPPPIHSPRVPLIVSKKDESFLWCKATVEEVAGCSFFQKSSLPESMSLLVSSDLCAPPRVRTDDMLEVINAQQSTNPFLLDPSLEHMDWLSKEPLPPAISSGLTTTAAQYGYTSFSWLEASAARDNDIRCHGEPHKIVAMESVSLLHVSQLPLQRQRALLDITPRHVLLNAMQHPFVRSRTRWLKAKTYGITLPLRREDLPVGAEERLSHPLLWVECGTPQPDSAALTRNRTVIKFFFNASQVITEDVERAVG
ncbi:hypothetical protein STCU_06894 [Strigomonas culicis]|uniref:Uncharacterized protein n=1 Tax=Strigomonas culicis TaxID=28005 RepID=S9VNX4_9TRYP|nr:hypothetical protein STCU_06894 [Strigomonas culicis]|eukprot:EPY25000.1 hypothetical protein STCU_06894 [Strigomonas culicis]